MKVFHCDHCEHLIFFESVTCVACGHALAYLPDLGVNGSLDQTDEGLWSSPIERAKGKTYRLCRNYTDHNVCNWAVPADDPNPYCESCRLTTVIPNFAPAGHKEAWYKLELAKRRLLNTLRALKLPIVSKAENPTGGLAFEFLADPEDPALPRVLTGHADGLITVNLAEADDAERERRRTQMREPYRTVLGHFRHEVGHYYWDVLIKDGPHRARFRELFGDESADYGAALQSYYQTGAPANWQDSFISTYATAHPWEDWAETWAHYLHMVDALEIAVDCGISIRPRRPGEPSLRPSAKVVSRTPSAFDAMIESWHPLTYVLNNLNRGLGQPDGYPFVISEPVIEKLRFVHDVTTTPVPEVKKAPPAPVAAQ